MPAITASYLSKREKEVLKLISQEQTSHEIARSLYISFHTVISHRKSLLEKLESKNVAGLVRRGFELGFLQIHQQKV